ncbi:cellulose synthase (UDP-forming) [Friedmanniella endophytica]|uniref:Cellulose synthase (UDP-forming) n=1 Tax=Microlunatus kandeliicorticis TaxID=1759536 RepID=A0A7W3P4V0_9ACTN|nr:cellulose synthase catalytic subunit [Microlunatus kandeliicorticis]MBA8793212.1 cellulose synthase (UDP-forming) [Microlunatus kandeliicorticis]
MPTRAETNDFAQVDKHVPVTRRVATANPYSPVMILLSLIATLGILLYGQFLLNPRNRGDWLPYALVITAETILVAHALLAMWTILSGAKSPRDFAFHEAKSALFDHDDIRRRGLEDHPEQWPILLKGRRATVDVFITVYGEELAKIRATATAALKIKGEHRTWILDDGRSDEVRELAAELGCHYLRRLSSNGAKAGNVNYALSVAKGDYFCIFDADFVPKQDFLLETVPFFVNANVAFVQTPQTYGNLTTMIARGAGYMQAVFYRFVQPGRNHFNAAFCVGTNVIFRRAAINDIGGIYADSKSEDVWTSLMLHERGWKTIYIAKTLAVGDAPETIEAYTKQQLRWATGGFEIMLTHNPLSPRRRLTLDQRLMYLVTATHYLTGIAPGLLLLVPPLEIFFDLRPVNLHIGWETWLLFYAGFYVLQILLAFYTLGSFRWEVLMLAAVSFPIYAKALVNAIMGKEQKWHVTGSKTKADSPFNFIVPQVMTFVFLLLTAVVSVWRDHSNSTFSLATAWTVTNLLILGSFMVVAFREAHRIRHPKPARTPLAVEELDDEPMTKIVVPSELESVLGAGAAFRTGADEAHRSPAPRPPARPEPEPAAVPARAARAATDVAESTVDHRPARARTEAPTAAADLTDLTHAATTEPGRTHEKVTLS